MTLAYLATPYSRYPLGLEQAFVDACALAARLISAGLHVYSPIAHSHGIAMHGAIEPLDQQFWMAFNGTMLNRCDELFIAHLDGWENSSGIAYEIDYFGRRKKPIFDLNPSTLQMVRRRR